VNQSLGPAMVSMEFLVICMFFAFLVQVVTAAP
jgi:hypothetical protein